MTDFLALRTRLDYWRNRYARTRHDNDYIKYHAYLKQYMSLIDSGAIPRNVVEQQNPYDPVDSRKDIEKTVFSSAKTVPREMDILSLFKQRKGLLTTQEILSRIKGDRGYTRVVLNRLEEDGVLEKIPHLSDKREFLWRKNANYSRKLDDENKRIRGKRIREICTKSKI